VDVEVCSIDRLKDEIIAYTDVQTIVPFLKEPLIFSYAATVGLNEYWKSLSWKLQHDGVYDFVDQFDPNQWFSSMKTQHRHWELPVRAHLFQEMDDMWNVRFFQLLITDIIFDEISITICTIEITGIT